MAEFTIKKFMGVKEFIEFTGLSEWYIRHNLDKLPHIQSGAKYLFNVPKCMEFLDALSEGDKS